MAGVSCGCATPNTQSRELYRRSRQLDARVKPPPKHQLHKRRPAAHNGDPWPPCYNHERSHQGYRNMGRQPIDTVNFFLGKRGVEAGLDPVTVRHDPLKYMFADTVRSLAVACYFDWIVTFPSADAGTRTVILVKSSGMRNATFRTIGWLLIQGVVLMCKITSGL